MNAKSKANHVHFDFNDICIVQFYFICYTVEEHMEILYCKVYKGAYVVSYLLSRMHSSSRRIQMRTKAPTEPPTAGATTLSDDDCSLLVGGIAREKYNTKKEYIAGVNLYYKQTALESF